LLAARPTFFGCFFASLFAARFDLSRPGLMVLVGKSFDKTVFAPASLVGTSGTPIPAIDILQRAKFFILG
jgi:hypothetical protein